MNKIAVLLTVHNRKQETLFCLKNLYNQKIPDNYTLDVYMTDDGCTDGTVETVRELFPEVRIIPGDGNLFWNRGMHKAWSEAEKNDYDFYLWLNDDTNLFSDAILSLLSTSWTKKNEAIIVGYTLDDKKERITYGGRNKHTGLIANIESVTECDTWNGNIVLIPKNVYRIVGKNDPLFHHAIGDTDYGLRAKRLGIKSFISVQPGGICNNHQKMPKWCDPSINLFDRYRFLYKPGGNGSNPIEFFIYKKRHYGLLSAVMVFISNHIHALCPILWKNDPSKY